MRDSRITDGSRARIRPSGVQKERIDAFLQNKSAAACGFECGTGYDPGVVNAYCACVAGDAVESWRQWQTNKIARCGIIDKTKTCCAVVKARNAERVSFVVD